MTLSTSKQLYISEVLCQACSEAHYYQICGTLSSAKLPVQHEYEAWQWTQSPELLRRKTGSSFEEKKGQLFDLTFLFSTNSSLPLLSAIKESSRIKEAKQTNKESVWLKYRELNNLLKRKCNEARGEHIRNLTREQSENNDRP